MSLCGVLETLWQCAARTCGHCRRGEGGLGTSCYHAEMMSVRKIEVLLFDCGYSFRLMRGAPCRRSWRDGLDEVIDIHTDDVVVNSLR